MKIKLLFLFILKCTIYCSMGQTSDSGKIYEVTIPNTNASTNELQQLQYTIDSTAYIFYKKSYAALKGEGFAKELALASTFYEFDKKKEAKALYKKAAAKGSSAAFFSLGDLYEDGSDDQLKYFIEAAKRGHEKALGYAITELFYGSQVFYRQPQQALNLYKIAKEVNPEIVLDLRYTSVYVAEEDVLETLEIAASIPKLDTSQFFRKHNITRKDWGIDGYAVWELAEKLAAKSKEENVTSLLILQLIIQGGNFPDEINSNIQGYYSAMNATDSIVAFSLCFPSNFATHSDEYCLGREDFLIKDLTITTLSKIVDALHIEATISENAQEAFNNYLEKKLWEEDQHTCSSDYYELLLRNSIDMRKDYLNLIDRVKKRDYPVVNKSLKENDSLLNRIYQVVLEKLGNRELSCNRINMKPDDIREVQRLWITYRDKNATLFAAIAEEKEQSFWLNYLTEVRVKSLQDLNNFIDEWFTYR